MKSEASRVHSLLDSRLQLAVSHRRGTSYAARLDSKQIAQDVTEHLRVRSFVLSHFSALFARLKIIGRLQLCR
jgi:hypothetical protein